MSVPPTPIHFPVAALVCGSLLLLSGCGDLQREDPPPPPPLPNASPAASGTVGTPPQVVRPTPPETPSWFTKKLNQTGGKLNAPGQGTNGSSLDAPAKKVGN